MIVLSKPHAIARVLDLVFREPAPIVLCPGCELRIEACICDEGERRRCAR